MNGTIEDVLTALNRWWGDAYVVAQENVAIANEVQSKLDEMARHAAAMTTLAIVCASVAFILAVGAATVLIYQRTSARNE